MSVVRGRGFEWFVAWRHLRDPERKSRRTLVFGLAALGLAAVCLLAGRGSWPASMSADVRRRPTLPVPPRMRNVAMAPTLRTRP